jgi:arylsulfatase
MKQTRRAVLASLAASLNGGAAQRPNVLVVMSDQESALLPGPARLPNRRRLEERGTVFTQAFCTTPQCSAARSSLLTGLEPHHTGVVTNASPDSLGKPLPNSLPTVGSVFGAAGYRTGYFGKWHLGQDRSLKPFGFDEHGMGTDDEIVKKAAGWIRVQKGPWLAWVSIINPHDIYAPLDQLRSAKPRDGVRPPSSSTRNLAGKPREQQEFGRNALSSSFSPEDWASYRRYYLNLVEKVDSGLGVLLDAAGSLDSTIVVYTSDHGDLLGEHGLPQKGPMMYEELIRIPLLIAAPKGLIGMGRRDDFVNQTDVAPTLAAMAGLRWPGKVDGVDLSKQRSTRDAVFIQYYAQKMKVAPIRAVRTSRWKMSWYRSGSKELYDLQSDPHELRNLSGDPANAATQAELEKRIEAWRPAHQDTEARPRN